MPSAQALGVEVENLFAAQRKPTLKAKSLGTDDPTRLFRGERPNHYHHKTKKPTSVKSVLFALFEGWYAGDVHSGDEQMDVVSAFVGEDGFEVHHVAHDAVVACDAHCAKDLTCFTGNVYGHVHVVSFCH